MREKERRLCEPYYIMPRDSDRIDVNSHDALNPHMNGDIIVVDLYEHNEDAFNDMKYAKKHFNSPPDQI